MDKMINEIFEFVANVLKTRNRIREKGILLYMYASN